MSADALVSDLKDRVSIGLLGPYLKIGIATLVGAGLALGIFFLISADSLGGQGQPTSLCICPNCGFMVPRPAGMDCEEVNCPSCGYAMNNASLLAAARQPPPMSQNQRETLAEQGIVTPGPMTQNQRETLAEQGIPVAAMRNAQPAPTAGLGFGNNGGTFGRELPFDNRGDLLNRGVQPDNRGDLLNGGVTLDNRADRLGRAVAAAQLAPIPAPGICLCPNCGAKQTRQPNSNCSQTRCSTCGAPMTNGVFVGHGPATGPTREPRLAAMETGMGNAGMGTHRNAPQPQGAGPPCQAAGGGQQAFPRAAATGGNNQQCPQGGGGSPIPTDAATTHPATIQLPNYSRDIQPIIASNCLRCHGGPIRNLSTYDNVKAYVDNGLLMMMVQPGGPMSRFLTANEAHEIISWIHAGTPR